MNMRYRLVTEKDASLLMRHRNENRHGFLNSDLVTEEQTRQWIIDNLLNPNDMMFVIETFWTSLGPEGSDLVTASVGQFSVYNIEQGNKADAGRLIRYKGASYYDEYDFIEVCTRILEDVSWLFSLKEIQAEVFCWNKRTLLFDSRLGFKIDRLVKDEDDSKNRFGIVWRARRRR
jgi:hypothetical protein